MRPRSGLIRVTSDLLHTSDPFHHLNVDGCALESSNSVDLTILDSTWDVPGSDSVGMMNGDGYIVLGCCAFFRYSSAHAQPSPEDRVNPHTQLFQGILGQHLVVPRVHLQMGC